MRTRHGEVAPLTVHLHGCFWMWRSWYTPTDPAGDGPTNQDMDASLAGRVFRVAWKVVQVALGPRVDAAIRVDTMVQVHAGVIAREDVAQAVIVPSPLGLHCLGIAR